MAKETLSELVIGLSLDTEDFLKGIEVSLQKVQEIGEKIRGALGGAAGAVSTETAAAASSANAAGGAVEKLGKKAQEAGDSAHKSFSKLPKVLMDIRGSFLGIVSSISGAVAATKLFDNYVGQGKGLSDLSRKIGMSVETIDAWSKANEAAGGTAEALQESLESFYRKTGRPATEFLRLGEKIEGMSRLQAQRFLEAQGVALNAIPVFLNGQKAADALVAKYRKTAFTTQDAKNAQAFKTAWLDFKVAAQDVGNVFLRALVPGLTKVMNALSQGVGVIRENVRFFTLLGGVMAAAFALKTIRSVVTMTAALKAFAASVSFAFKPLAVGAALITALALAIDDLLVFVKGGDSALESFLKKIGVPADVIEGLRSTLADLQQAFSDAWEAVKPFVGDLVVTAFKGIAFVVGKIALAIAAVIAGLVGIAVGVKKAIDWFGELDDKAKKWLDELSADCRELGQEVADWFASVPDRLIDAFSSAYDSLAEVFSGWLDLFTDKVLGPIKNAWAGIKSFFGFGDNDSGNGTPEATAEQKTIVVERGRNAPPTITSSSNLYMTNNITTQDSPAAIGSSVGRFAYAGAQRSNNAFYQSMRGVRLK